MNVWRIAFALGLLTLVGVPVAAPFSAVVSPATWVWTAEDGNRLLHLSSNTLVLVFGTAMVAVPIGLTLAVLLFRSEFFGRRCLLAILAVTLFIPLPVIVSSWQAALGTGGWLPLEWWRTTADRPWATGMFPAIWVHALASVPWVAIITGVGLVWVEPEWEEESRQVLSPLRVLIQVTLWRARASILAAFLFVILQTAGEISVTDMMLVSTFAEEAYTQFALGDAGLSRTIALWLPGLVLAWVGTLVVVARLDNSLPPLMAPASELRPILRYLPGLQCFISGMILIVLVAPFLSLIWKLGSSGYPPQFGMGTARHFLQAEARLLGRSLVEALSCASVTGFLVAGVALKACWLARDARWFRWLLFSLVTWVWVLPGPIVGMGLRDVISVLPEGPWKDALYYGPSPLPLMWAQAIRAFPVVVVLLWPVVRLLPVEMIEEAQLAGAGFTGLWFGVVLPMTWRAAMMGGLVATALCLGEVAASTRVETPGWESFTKLIFDRMHFGVDNNVSALCVLMLASLAGFAIAGGSVFLIARWFTSNAKST